MLVLINSSVNQSGVSTVSQVLAYTYSNWVTRPVLLVSVKSSEVYKESGTVGKDYISKNLSIVNGNTSGHGDIKNYTYKVNDLLYYYHAHSSATASERQKQGDLAVFLGKATREFGMVIVDLDESPISFLPLLSIADFCFLVVTPDNLVIKQTKVDVETAIMQYKETGGLKPTTQFRYILNKMDGGYSKSSATRILKAKQSDVLTVNYDPRFIKENNNHRLLKFVHETLLYSKTATDKVLEVNFRRIYDSLKKGW